MVSSSEDELNKEKQKLEEELQQIEKQIYNLEEEYLSDNCLGNVVKGYEGYLSTRKYNGSSQKKTNNKIKEKDRIFSNSSKTSKSKLNQIEINSEEDIDIETNNINNVEFFDENPIFNSYQQQQQEINVTDQQKPFKNNPYFTKLFDRIDGLLCILVSDIDGNIIARGFSDDCPIEFDSTFPATYLLANEQASKLPFGKDQFIISCYEEYNVLQTHTEPSQQPQEGEEEEFNDSLFVTFVCDSDTSLQLIMDLSDSIKETLQVLYNQPQDGNEQQ
ncbi:hypothetical protein ABK040_005682 [Willaertia magna]